jgi:hypothetical protein
MSQDLLPVAPAWALATQRLVGEPSTSRIEARQPREMIELDDHLHATTLDVGTLALVVER